jgi:hypothetical protein
MLHLILQGRQDFPGDDGAEPYLLQWVYGNVAHAGTGASCRFLLWLGYRGQASRTRCCAPSAAVGKDEEH